MDKFALNGTTFHSLSPSIMGKEKDILLVAGKAPFWIEIKAEKVSSRVRRGPRIITCNGP